MISHTFAVCAYKDSPYLESCIKSLLKQTIPVKIILCTSTPSPFLEQMAKKYHLPFHIREGQSDIQDDWNFAVQMADSDLVTIAHQDDMYHKTYAETVQKCWSRYLDATVMMTDAVIIKHGELQKPGSGGVCQKMSPSAPSHEPFQPSAMGETGSVDVWQSHHVSVLYVQ